MGKNTAQLVEVEGRVLQLTNLDKVFWPDQNLTKAHLIDYYREIAPLLLPHIRNRPLVLKRYPDGIGGDAFYQKQCPAYAPEWVKTCPVRHSGKVVNYIVCNDMPTLLWLANQGCLEIHGWLSRLDDIDHPDLAVIDLDPAPGVPFREVQRVALLAKEALDVLGIRGYPKTSGASGLHIFIPLNREHNFAQVVKAMGILAGTIARAYPAGATVERSVSRRGCRVYIDYLQNGRGKTMAFPYSVRPEPGAPVSTPLTWEELSAADIDPADWNMITIRERLRKMGDLYSSLLFSGQSLVPLLAEPVAKLDQRAKTGR